MVDSDRCIGCHLCLMVCPFGVPQYGNDGKMQKCDFCVDLLAQGKEPACVATCPAEALNFGTMEELNKMAAKKSVTKLAMAFLPTW
jgi:anaerobic dimethyl sulfoxide reductase subunit B